MGVLCLDGSQPRLRLNAHYVGTIGLNQDLIKSTPAVLAHDGSPFENLSKSDKNMRCAGLAKRETLHRAKEKKKGG